jgi:hypothetical protein
MMVLKHAIAATIAGFLAAQPCAGAYDPGSYGEGRMSSFAGVNVRMPVGKISRARPSARVQLTTAYSIRDVRTGAVETLKAKGLEIGATRKGVPALYLNGQNTAEMQEKFRLSSSTPDSVSVILGVALLAVGVLVITNLDSLGD